MRLDAHTDCLPGGPIGCFRSSPALTRLPTSSPCCREWKAADEPTHSGQSFRLAPNSHNDDRDTSLAELRPRDDERKQNWT
jgi:hypothetical protein